MSLSHIMSTRVVSVHMDDSLELIQTLFAETGFHHLVVVPVSYTHLTLPTTPYV